mgnify:CR=1 FL=1
MFIGMGCARLMVRGISVPLDVTSRNVLFVPERPAVKHIHITHAYTPVAIPPHHNYAAPTHQSRHRLCGRQGYVREKNYRCRSHFRSLRERPHLGNIACHYICFVFVCVSQIYMYVYGGWTHKCAWCLTK